MPSTLTNLKNLSTPHASGKWVWGESSASSTVMVLSAASYRPQWSCPLEATAPVTPHSLSGANLYNDICDFGGSGTFSWLSWTTCCGAQMHVVTVELSQMVKRPHFKEVSPWAMSILMSGRVVGPCVPGEPCPNLPATLGRTELEPSGEASPWPSEMVWDHKNLLI